jgi:diacylglycerol kinase family enzyme
MHAVLVVNPSATTTTRRARDVLVSALGDAIKLQVVETEARGHAREIAAEAAEEGADVVLAFGGDGTVNEVANGLVGDGTRDAQEIPALAVVPGGATNVFIRALGQPSDAIEATGGILQALRAGTTRTVSLGAVHADDEDRIFVFAGGLGIDGAAVRRVESHRSTGRRASHPLFVRQTLAQYYRGTDRHRPGLTLQVPGHEPEQVFIALVTNTDPWTYLGNRPVRATPQASFDTGLDVFAMRRFGTLRTMRHLSQILRGGPHGRHVVLHHDLSTLTVSSPRPVSLQVDGDYLGEHVSATFRSLPQALRVVLPEPGELPQY